MCYFKRVKKRNDNRANGIGKTTFIKHFIQKKLENADILVLSPTHMLYQKYNENDIIIYHIDLYNYQSLDKSELTEMKQIIDSSNNIFNF